MFIRKKRQLLPLPLGIKTEISLKQSSLNLIIVTDKFSCQSRIKNETNKTEQKIFVRQAGFEPRSPATFAQDVTARSRKRERIGQKYALMNAAALDQI